MVVEEHLSGSTQKGGTQFYAIIESGHLAHLTTNPRQPAACQRAPSIALVSLLRACPQLATVYCAKDRVANIDDDGWQLSAKQPDGVAVPNTFTS